MEDQGRKRVKLQLLDPASVPAIRDLPTTRPRPRTQTTTRGGDSVAAATTGSVCWGQEDGEPVDVEVNRGQPQSIVLALIDSMLGI